RIADPRGADITVRQLLEQTSGLADSTVHPIARQQPGSLAEAVSDLSAARLVARPSTFDGGDGGVVSSAADMAKWLVVQTNHGRAVDGTQVISDRGLTEQH